MLLVRSSDGTAFSPITNRPVWCGGSDLVKVCNAGLGSWFRTFARLGSGNGSWDPSGSGWGKAVLLTVYRVLCTG